MSSLDYRIQRVSACPELRTDVFAPVDSLAEKIENTALPLFEQSSLYISSPTSVSLLSNSSSAEQRGCSKSEISSQISELCTNWIYSRLKEMCYFAELNGPDRRIQGGSND